jgi:hypothetical protein
MNAWEFWKELKLKWGDIKSMERQIKYKHVNEYA